MFEVNVKAPRRLAQAAWPALTAAGRGRVDHRRLAVGQAGEVRRRRASTPITKFAAVALAHGIRHAGLDAGHPRHRDLPRPRRHRHGPRADRARPRPTDPAGGLARIVAMVLDLPNTASVAELPVNCPAGRILLTCRSLCRPFHGDAELPAKVDVVVIGGGIIGSLDGARARRARRVRRAVREGRDRPASSRAATGAGCASRAATRARCR